MSDTDFILPERSGLRKLIPPYICQKVSEAMAIGRRAVGPLQATRVSPPDRARSPHHHHAGRDQPTTRLRLRLRRPNESADPAPSTMSNHVALIHPPSAPDPSSRNQPEGSRAQPGLDDMCNHLRITRKRVIQGIPQYKLTGWLPVNRVPEPLLQRCQMESQAAQATRENMLRRLRPRRPR